MNPVCVSARRFAPSKLGLAVSAVLLGNALPALASQLTPIDGPGGTPTLSETGGVPIINIVKPNASGLSHNQYLDYNVDGHGVIINNSRVDGVTRSNINGPQAIFGQQADYVLANPNGITLNGATLENAQRATFLVGSATVADGQLRYLDTQAAKGQLKVDKGGVSNAAGALALIAPSIAGSGDIRSEGNLDLILGANKVDYRSNEVIASANLPKRLDANLLGAMASGNRISIVSTESGAGIKLPGSQLKAEKGLRITSAGDINLAAPSRAGKPMNQTRLQAGADDLNLRAAGQLNLGNAQASTAAHANLSAETLRSQGAEVTSAGTLRIAADTVTHTHSSRLQGAEIGVDVTGKLTDGGTHYTSTSGALRMAADSHEMKATVDKAVAGAATTHTARPGSLTSAQGIEVKVASHARYEGTQFNAAQGPVEVKTGGNLSLTQANNLLSSNSKTGVHETRTAVPSHLKTPGKISLQAGRDIQLNGVDIGTAEHKAQSLAVNAGGTLTSLAAIGKGTVKAHGQSDVAGGQYQLSQSDESHQTQVGNQWHITDTLALQASAKKARAIHLQGVQADAASIGLNATAGGIYLEGASSQTQRDNKQLTTDTSDSGTPGVLLSHHNEEAQTHRNAQLSAATVSVDSVSDVNLAGARIDAGTLTGTIGGKLTASNRADSTQTLNVSGNAQAADRSHPMALLSEMSTLAGKWNKPGKDALGQLPPGKQTVLEQASFEFDRVDKGGITQVSLVSATDGTTLKVAGGSHIAADSLSIQDLQTTHRVTTRKGGLEDAKRLYEQVRIR